MLTTKYLYNCLPTEFMDLPYSEALQYKIDRADELVTELFKPHYMNRDNGRLRDVFAAVSHNENLLKEIKSTTKT